MSDQFFFCVRVLSADGAVLREEKQGAVIEPREPHSSDVRRIRFVRPILVRDGEMLEISSAAEGRP